MMAVFSSLDEALAAESTREGLRLPTGGTATGGCDLASARTIPGGTDACAGRVGRGRMSPEQ